MENSRVNRDECLRPTAAADALPVVDVEVCSAEAAATKRSGPLFVARFAGCDGGVHEAPCARVPNRVLGSDAAGRGLDLRTPDGARAARPRRLGRQRPGPLRQPRFASRWRPRRRDEGAFRGAARRCGSARVSPSPAGLELPSRQSTPARTARSAIGSSTPGGRPLSTGATAPSEPKRASRRRRPSAAPATIL